MKTLPRYRQPVVHHCTTQKGVGRMDYDRILQLKAIAREKVRKIKEQMMRETRAKILELRSQKNPKPSSVNHPKVEERATQVPNQPQVEDLHAAQVPNHPKVEEHVAQVPSHPKVEDLHQEMLVVPTCQGKVPRVVPPPKHRLVPHPPLTNPPPWMLPQQHVDDEETDVEVEVEVMDMEEEYDTACDGESNSWFLDLQSGDFPWVLTSAGEWKIDSATGRSSEGLELQYQTITGSTVVAELQKIHWGMLTWPLQEPPQPSVDGTSAADQSDQARKRQVALFQVPQMSPNSSVKTASKHIQYTVNSKHRCTIQLKIQTHGWEESPSISFWKSVFHDVVRRSLNSPEILQRHMFYSKHRWYSDMPWTLP